MSLLWMDTLDYYAAAHIGTKYTVGGGQFTTSGRTGNGYRDGYLIRQFAASTTSRITAGFAWRSTSAGAGSGYSFYGSDGLAQITVVPSTAGALAVYMSAGSAWYEPRYLSWATYLGTTADGVVTFNNVWYYIETQVVTSNTVGSVLIHVNGVNCPTTPDLSSGIDTSRSQENCRGFGVSVDYYGTFDDIYVLDAVASGPTTFLGDARADAMLPVTPNGTDTDFSRSTGSDDWAVTDENPTNTTDYIYTNTIGHKTSLNVAVFTNTGGSIQGVQVSAYATKSNAGPCGFKIYALVSGTRYYSGEFIPSYGSWSFFSYIWNLNPATSAAWEESAFNAAEFGVERTT